jgi:hypothetical protein
MKMRHCLALLIFGLSLFLNFGFSNAASAQSADGGPRILLKDFKVGDDGKAQYHFGVTPATQELGPQQVAQPENHYLAKLRDQLNAYKAESSMKDRGTHVSFVKFTNETAAFFVAIGAVQFQNLIIEFSDNPSGLAAHLNSVKDPIAHISFYMFLLSQGHTAHYLEAMMKERKDVTMQVAKRFLGYGGMAAGSFVSGLTTEVLTGIKNCAKTLFPNPKDSEQVQADLKVCEAANKSMAASRGIQKLTTQVVSLLATAGAVSFVESTAIKAATLTGAQLAKALALKSGSVFATVGMQLAFLGTPGGWVVKGLSIVGKIGKFYLFTAGGEEVNPAIEKLLGNTFKPIEFHYDAKNFEAAVKKSKEYNWQDAKSNTEVAKELDDMTDLMSRWRQQQLLKFYTAHSIWGDNVARVLDQTHTTFNFYKVYLENLFKTLQVGTKIRNRELPAQAMNGITYYPFRTLPLYGVKLDPDPMSLEVQEDQYLNQPVDLEKRQMLKVRAASKFIRESLKTMRLTQVDSQWLNEILVAFEGNNAKAMGQAILKLNSVAKNQALVKVEGKEQLQRVAISPELQRLMTSTRRFLGDPNPIMSPGMGFSYAYETNTYNNKAMRTLERPLAPGIERVRTSDYLWMQMACGSVDDLYANVPGSTPYFKPPKLIRKDLHTPELCRAPFDQRRSNDRHELDIYTQAYQSSDGKTYNGINDLIYLNMRSDVLGDFTKDQVQTIFPDWWTNTVSTPLVALFKEFDVEYIHVLEHLTDNWNDRESSYLDRINTSNYLSKDVLENLSFELNIHANVLNDLLNGRVRQDRTQPSSKDAKADREDLAKRTPVKNYFSSSDKYISPTIKALSAALPPALEDKQGLLLRLRASAEADIQSRQKVNEAVKARASAEAAKTRLKNLLSTPELTKEEAARITAASTSEIARLEKLAIAAEQTAQQAVARLKPQVQDTSLIRGEQYAKLQEIAELIEATQMRINILRQMRVVKGRDGKLFVQNFPTKEDSLKAAERTTKAMSALGEIMKSVQSSNGFGETQFEVATKALAGMESVISDVGTMTMAFYMTKYKLGDDVGQLLAELKQSNNETPKVKPAVSKANGL